MSKASLDQDLDRRMKRLALRRKRITQPSVVEGLARIFDIAGTMRDKPTSEMYIGRHLTKSSSELRGLDNDTKKLASDWYAVVDDLDKATKKFVAREGLSK